MTKTKPSRRRRSGFTLVEIMIAMGILAMALPMIASTLMAGMIAKKEAIEKTMATIVAENAVSVIRVRVSNRDLAADWGVGQSNLPRLTGVISDADKNYKPCGEESLYGYEILGQRMAEGANDFRFAVLVFRKLSDTDTVNTATVTIDPATGLLAVPPAANGYKVTTQQGGTDSMAIYCYVTRMSLRE